MLVSPCPTGSYEKLSYLELISLHCGFLRSPVPYITALSVLKPSDPVPDGYTLSDGDDLHNGAWPKLPGLLLAYKLQTPPDPDALGAAEGMVDEEEVVTEVDVLYGEGKVSGRSLIRWHLLSAH